MQPFDWCIKTIARLEGFLPQVEILGPTNDHGLSAVTRFVLILVLSLSAVFLGSCKRIDDVPGIYTGAYDPDYGWLGSSETSEFE